MPPESHQRLRQIFEDALERPEADRPAFVNAACGADTEACQAVLRLLQAHQPAQSFLESPAPGAEQKVGRYLITGELGRGAMGVVYEAVDPLIDRKVALKVIHMATLTQRGEAVFLRDRLFREARSAGQLLHPGIVILFDVGQEGDLAYITMERVNGLSLQKILESGRRLDPHEVIRILRETAEALDYAHRHSVVHCDVKPGNIILDRNGPAKLADFGIAKITSTQYHTRSGLLMGTPGYMAPEQIEGKTLDGRTDQFALAVLAFQLLTGRMPFQGDTIAGMAYAIVHTQPPSARALNPDLGPAVDQVLARGLAKSPSERFPTCAELVRALDAALFPGGPIPHLASAAAPIPVAATAAGRRSSVGPWLVSILSVLVVIAAGVYYEFPRKAPRSAAVTTLAPGASSAPPSPAPAIARFIAEPAAIKAGASAKLRWDVKGASKIVIEPAIGTVPSTGAADVKPGEPTLYRLTATGPGGQTATQTLRVNVDRTPDASSILSKAESERQAGHKDEALALFHQAADLGEPRAMEALGSAADDAKNYSEAAQWFRKAADRGNAAAMRRLGGLYYLGQGVPQDASAAAYWFGKASGGGDAAAKFDLGMLYENGSGVAKDMAKAEQFYRDAAALGNEEARRRLDRLP